jgi:hypothetical protein
MPERSTSLNCSGLFTTTDTESVTVATPAELETTAKGTPGLLVETRTQNQAHSALCSAPHKHVGLNYRKHWRETREVLWGRETG